MQINETKPFQLELVLEASKPAVVRVLLWEKGKKHTVYSDRLVGSEDSPILGRETVYFNFPVMAQNLTIRVENATIVSKKLNPLQVKPITDAKLAEYLKLAKEFAYNCPYLQTVEQSGKAYTSDNNYFVIRYLDVIRDYEKGIPVDTPARGSLGMPLIEVRKRDFLKMSVANRLSVLLHEYRHSAYKSESEIDCDLFAAKCMLDMGYDRMETLYALTKLFMDNMNIDPRLRIEQENRTATIAKFIGNYNRS